MKTSTFTYTILTTIAVFFVACSTKKNTFVSRNYNALTTKDNVLYNGNLALDKGIIDLKDNGEDLIIKFLDNQLNEVEIKSKTNSSNGSKGGRPKKNPIESEIKPNKNPIESESKAIREDKIKEDNKKESKPSLETRSLAFKETLRPFLNQYGADMLKSFYNYWSEPNQSKTKMLYEMQKTWDNSRRLATWSKREKDFIKKDDKPKSLGI